MARCAIGKKALTLGAAPIKIANFNLGVSKNPCGIIPKYVRQGLQGFFVP